MEHRCRVGAGRRRGGGVDGERPILEGLRILPTRRLRLWTSITLFVLLAAYQAYAVATVARSAEQRASLRQQVGTITAVLPHTRTELYWFGGVSLTAGFCEEFLYRGYFVWVFSPWLGWWGAAALSLLFFATGHLYQGWNGVLRTAIIGAIFTLVVAIFGSLWPGIALHALVDFGSGMMAWLVLSEGSAGGDVVGWEWPTGPQSAPGVRSSPIQAEPGAGPDRGGMETLPDSRWVRPALRAFGHRSADRNRPITCHGRHCPASQSGLHHCPASRHSPSRPGRGQLCAVRQLSWLCSRGTGRRSAELRSNGALPLM